MHYIGPWIYEYADIGVVAVIIVLASLFVAGARAEDKWCLKSRRAQLLAGEDTFKANRRLLRSLAQTGNPYYVTSCILLAGLALSLLSPAAFFTARPCGMVLATFDFGKYLVIGAFVLFWFGARAGKRMDPELEMEIELDTRIYAPLQLRLQGLYNHLAIVVIVVGAPLAILAIEVSKSVCR